MADLELLTIKLQQMTIESTNLQNSTDTAITYSECYQQCFCSDNLELMKTIESNTIDLIYCDILYGTGRKFGDYQDLKPIRSEIESHYLPRLIEMGKKWERTLSEAIGLFSVHINSALVSAQNRKRIYWTNIRTKQMGLFGDIYSDIPQPEDRGILLKDILEDNVDEKYYLSEKMLKWLDKHAKKRGVDVKKLDGEQKTACLTATAQVKQNLTTDYVCVAMRGRGENNEQQLEPNTSCKTNALTSVQKDNLVYQFMIGTSKDFERSKYDTKSYALDTSNKKGIEIKNTIRRLTPTECSRLQTIPEWYRWECSDTQAYKMLGNGWTVEVIKHILQLLEF